MALDSNILKLELSKIFDAKHPQFVKFPESLADAAEKWSAAFDKYASVVTPPSTTAAQAKQAFKGLFMTIQGANGPVVLPQCFAAYAAALALGMQPTFTGTPPVGTPILAPVPPVGLAGGTAAECIDMIVTIVHNWMLTGVAVNNSSAATVTWL
jgi:hypothetical protein